MSCQQVVYQWTEGVTPRLPQLSKAQATVWTLWSVGMVGARRCAVSAVGLLLAHGLERQPNSRRQQSREFCYKAKRREPRRFISDT